MTGMTVLQPPVGAGGFEMIEFHGLARLGRPHAGTAQTSMLQHGRPQKLLRGAPSCIQQNPTKFRSQSCTGTEPDRVRPKTCPIRRPAAVGAPRSAACASLDLMGAKRPRLADGEDKPRGYTYWSPDLPSKTTATQVRPLRGSRSAAHCFPFGIVIDALASLSK